MQARKRLSRFLPTVTLAALAAMAAMAFMVTPSHASVAIALSIDDVARGSTLVARVTPIDRACAWEDGRIVTTTRLHVDRTIAGSPGATEEIRVRTLGGVIDNIGHRVEGEPTFEPGQPSIVFVAPAKSKQGQAFGVVGRAQGQLALVREPSGHEGREPSGREPSGREIARVRGTGALVARPSRAPLAAAGPLVTSFDGVAADEAAKIAAAAWERTHAR